MLSESKVDFEFRDLISSPPSETELREITQLNGLSLAQLVNTRSQTYKKLKPKLVLMNEQQIIKLIQDNPKIIVRPVLSDGQRSLIGFKDEAYLDLLKQKMSIVF